MSDNTTNNNASGNGNVAALREAVERSTRRLESLISYIPPEWEKYVNADIRDNLAALALRPRNCDVGTVEEQMKRWRKYCENFHYCVDCPLNKENGLSLDCLSADCFASWAQTPYEAQAQEGGNNAD